MSVDLNRDEIVAALKVGVVDVEFNKTDGSVRGMSATLLEEYIPPKPEGTGTSTRKQNPNVVAVIDVDLGEWRSFRIDSLVSFVPRSVDAA